jgi:alpha-tubulin suppressor-like RCC1 family protein
MPLSKSPVNIGGGRYPVGFPSPVQVGIGTSFTHVSAGGLTTLAIDTNNKLFVFGLNQFGQLGLGITMNRSSPVQISATTSWIDASSGSEHSVAINSLGQLFTWGYNNVGQLGNATTINRSSPVQITNPSLSWSTVSAGLSASLGKTSTGLLYLWGLNNIGQSSSLNTVNYSSPALIVSPFNTSSWNFATAGFSNSVGIRADGTLWHWGLQQWGQGSGFFLNNIHRSSPYQIGNQYIFFNISSPSVVQSESSFSQVAAGIGISAAIDTTGRLFTWGLNPTGQLGDGTAVTRSMPFQITIAASSVSSFSQVANGDSHMLAISSGPGNIGSLWTWGLNNNGQLGDNSITNRNTPQKIGSASWTKIGAGLSYSTGIQTDGSLWVWGLGTSGQIGDGTTVSKSNPTKVGTSSWTVVARGLASGHVPAIRQDNSIFQWGVGSNGVLSDIWIVINRSSPNQLGNNWSGSYAQVTEPMQIPGSWISVTAGWSFTLAVDSNYRLYTWGSATNGRLGLGDTLNRSSPTLVSLSNTYWTQVACGQNSGYGLASAQF